LAIFEELIISREKALTMAILTPKVNEQIGVEEFKYRRPPIYRSRDTAKFWTKNRLRKALTMAMLPVNYP